MCATPCSSSATILTVDGKIPPGPKTKGDSRHDDSYPETEKPSVFKKMQTDLGVSQPETVSRDFRQVSQRAQTVAKAAGLPAPKSIKPTSPAKDIEAAVELSERHTEARNEAKAEGGDPRRVMPITPQPATFISVKIDIEDPKRLIEWFRDSMSNETKPITEAYIRKLAKGLLKLVGD